MKRAPRIAAIQDISGFGRCSTTVVLPVLAAMGGECCPLLTACLSAHTAFPASEKATFLDLTGQMAGTAAHWAELGVTFDAIYSGFLGSAGQIGLIEDFYRQFRREGTLVLVDPVMGDHGKPYRTYTPELCGRMRDLAAQADVITPNVTEAAILLGKDVRDEPDGPAEAARWARGLERAYGAKVVLTGLSGGGATVGVLCCEEGRTAFFEHARIREYYPGTGDIFSSVLLWPDRSPPSSPEPAIFSPAWCWGRCSGGSRWRQRPSGRRSLSSGAQPTPWRWAPRFWRGSSSSHCWES